MCSAVLVSDKPLNWTLFTCICRNTHTNTLPCLFPPVPIRIMLILENSAGQVLHPAPTFSAGCSAHSMEQGGESW